MDIVNSSTPDGLAPLSGMGLIIFLSIFSGLAILWGLFNFLRLYRTGPEYQQTVVLNGEKDKLITEMTNKIFLGSLNFMKFNLIATFTIIIVFFVLIMWLVEQFQAFQYSVVYILGAITTIICEMLILVIASISYYRIVYSSKYYADVVFALSKFATNSITFISNGVLLASIIGLFIYFKPIQTNIQPQDINNFTNIFIFFTFGFVTVTFCTKITTIFYSKGSQISFQLAKLFNCNSIPYKHQNPMILAKSVGQNLNRAMSKTLDYLMYILISISLTMKAAGMNIIGTDQQGEIIFDLSYQNTYTAMLLIGYAIIFSLFFTLYEGSPSDQGEVKNNFMFKAILITAFLFGFTSLACYLTLPAQFQILTFRQQQYFQVKSPLYAYILVIIGMSISILITFSSQIIGSSPYFIYSLLQSCKTGGATCIISGLSMGYMYTILPTLALASFGFLAYWWLGIFGVAMFLFGFVMFIPYYMNVNLYHSLMNVSSMIGFVTKIQQQSEGTLLSLNESKKYFQQKVLLHYNALSFILSYLGISLFIQLTKQSDLSISQGYLFSGMLLGAMFPYIFIGLLIKLCYLLAPILCYDIEQQIKESQMMQQFQINFERSNQFMCLNSNFQIIKMIPFILFTLLLGVLFGVKILIGFLSGYSISSIQLSISSLISGTLWKNVRDQISYGRAKDQDNNDISVNSEWGKASQIGTNIGETLRDCAGQASHIFQFLIMFTAHGFAVWFIR